MVFFPPTPLLHMHCGFILLPEFRFEECVELTVASALRTGCEILSGLVGSGPSQSISTAQQSHRRVTLNCLIVCICLWLLLQLSFMFVSFESLYLSNVEKITVAQIFHHHRSSEVVTLKPPRRHVYVSICICFVMAFWNPNSPGLIIKHR